MSSDKTKQVIIEKPIKLIDPEDKFIPVDRRIKYDPIMGIKVLELAMKGMKKSEISVLLGISRKQIDTTYHDDFERGKVNRKHRAVSKWDEAIEDGNWDALKFQLKTEHGYIEKAQMEYSGEVRAVVSNKPLSIEEFAAKYLQDQQVKTVEYVKSEALEKSEAEENEQETEELF